MVFRIRPVWPSRYIAMPSRTWRCLQGQQRAVSMGTLRYRTPPPPSPPPPKYRTEEAMKLHREKYIDVPRIPQHFKVYPPPGKSGKTLCKEPINAWNASQIANLDPTGARSRLFSKENTDCARVGDVLMVRFRSGDPFAGVCMNIRRRGVDTAILLRNHLTRVGTEMWVKIYSPTVVGMEIVERRRKRARRARLYYMRKPKHDRGSLEGLVERYMKNKLATGRGVTKAKRKAPTLPSSTPQADSSS